ncbi:[acyl-carrier-protein] S-malonyltransferase [Tardiphaga robiniae]|uniref:acyltransferase domain-containing protein n=1 Tax=Tardiphaga robiniae TaxID=943830 RepID=UPI0028647E93|nr:acyltransferase domain-containing protein [Tardiphaga robiniae]MDR6661300.1 [acyl-carrier-protein] S-malonyltransferase [Tardiphaga robiniae]
MTLAILCSGQGRQHAEMFALTGNVPSATAIFTHASNLLGSDVREFAQGASNEALHRNRAGQILCTTQALAAAAALEDAVADRVIVAGYSVGEVAAWGVAGAITPSDTLDLVADRAEAMDSSTASGDGLLFVRGLSRTTIDLLCDRHGASIAIVNPGDAFVIGGNRMTLQSIAADAKALHAIGIVDLPVEVASHTKQLIRASAVFRQHLTRVSVTFPPRGDTRILSGIDGASVLSLDAGLDKLAAQISQTVHWASCLQSCMEAGATAFLELGPGRALSGMVAGAWNDMPSRALDDFRSLQGVRDWLTRHVPS